MFFFEKKNQKTFSHGVRCRRVRDRSSKVFWFFFSKKNTSSYLGPQAISVAKKLTVYRGWRTWPG